MLPGPNSSASLGKKVKLGGLENLNYDMVFGVQRAK